MTTNRMGLEQTLSDERLEQYANDKRMCNVNDEIRDMARELLAYRKASMEPVADAVAWNKPGEERKCDIRWRRFDVAPGPLFAAPKLQDVKVQDGWQLVPIEPTYEMSNAIGLPWEEPPFPLRWKRMLEVCSSMKSVTNEP